jgi:anti-sigma factor RsiW
MMLSCQDITEVITDYIEGRMSMGKRLKFHMHLGMCRHCRRYLRQVRQTIRLSASLPRAPAPPEVHDELMRRFKNWKR